MTLKSLNIHHFRNILQQDLAFIPTINVIYGQNGSGKTSILEAIYFLTHGRSFRTRCIDRVVMQGQKTFTLLGNVEKAANMAIPIGLEKSIGGKTTLKIANNPVNSTAELASLYPILLINPDSYKLLEAGPKYRRQFLDWGLFHVEHQFYQQWRRYNKILRQRNACLRQHADRSVIMAWDQELITIAEKIDDWRQGYIQAFQPLFEEILAVLLPKSNLALHYSRGWSQKSSLEEVLQQTYLRDKERGYTQAGPHRGDLTIKIGVLQAHEILSRGQQKLLVFALRLAQGQLLKAVSEKASAFLIDDLPAELDSSHQHYVMQQLTALESQIIVTGIEPLIFKQLLSKTLYEMFHVEHGMVKK